MYSELVLSASRSLPLRNLAIPLLLHPIRVEVLAPCIVLHVPGLVLGPALSLAFPAAEVDARHLALGAQGAARVVAALGRRLATAKAVQARRLRHYGAPAAAGCKVVEDGQACTVVH